MVAHVALAPYSPEAHTVHASPLYVHASSPCACTSLPAHSVHSWIRALCVCGQLLFSTTREGYTYTHTCTHAYTHAHIHAYAGALLDDARGGQGDPALQRQLPPRSPDVRMRCRIRPLAPLPIAPRPRHLHTQSLLTDVPTYVLNYSLTVPLQRGSPRPAPLSCRRGTGWVVGVVCRGAVAKV